MSKSPESFDQLTDCDLIETSRGHYLTGILNNEESHHSKDQSPPLEFLSEKGWLKTIHGFQISSIPPYPIRSVGRVPKMVDSFTRVLQEQFVNRIRLPVLAQEEPHEVKLSSHTKFRRKSIPAISLLDYVTRICNFIVALEPSMLLAVLVYANVLDPPHSDNPTLIIDSFSVHRFFITAICVASKASGDYIYTNSFYAKVGGVSTEELNRLELELAQLLQWDLQCSVGDFEDTWKLLFDMEEVDL